MGKQTLEHIEVLTGLLGDAETGRDLQGNSRPEYARIAAALTAAIEALSQADKIAEIRAAIISRQKYLEGTDMSDYGWGKNMGIEEAIEIIDTTGGDDER